jgi:hypothetical protein
MPLIRAIRYVDNSPFNIVVQQQQQARAKYGRLRKDTMNFSQVSSQNSFVSMYNAHQLVKLTFRGILLQRILGTVTQKCEKFKNRSPVNEDFPRAPFSNVFFSNSKVDESPVISLIRRPDQV